MKYVHIGRRAQKLVLSFFLCLFVCLFIYFKNIQCHFRALSICITNWSSSLWHVELVMSPRYSRLVFLYLKGIVKTVIENEDCFQVHFKNMVKLTQRSRFAIEIPLHDAKFASCPDKGISYWKTFLWYFIRNLFSVKSQSVHSVEGLDICCLAHA